MPKVCVLPEHIASQIAAGEVVERPSSVVKELVENSIDAGANKIVISLSEGCRSIRVADNGCGMEPEDAVLAFQRHATSKLNSADELWQLNTLGFRGEALPSIASVSHLTCYTRTADGTAGTRVDCADGKLEAVETGCAVGTIIEITDLFYNVPARLKFLKKAQTEFAHIYETVQSLAIAYPKISFELFNDNDSKLSTSGSGNFTDALIAVGHFSNIVDIIEISASDETLGFTMEARLAGAKHFRGDRKGILSVVNMRPVRCSLTYKALDYAYADLIPRGRYPLAVVHLQIKPSELDVNIHPTKKEIKYAKGNDVYSFIQRQIVRALREGGSRKELDNFAPAEFGRPESRIDDSTTYVNLLAEPNLEQLNFKPSLHYQAALSDFIRENKVSENLVEGHAWRAPTNGGRVVDMSELLQADRGSEFRSHIGADGMPAPSGWLVANSRATDYGSDALHAPAVANPTDSIYADPIQSASLLPNDWKLIGYLHNTYILLQTAEGLSIVEQHIAHERTLYERLLLQQNDPQKSAENYQRLIISCPLNLTLEQVACLEQNIDNLAALGFEFEAISKNGSGSAIDPTTESNNVSLSKSESADSESGNAGNSSFACVQVPIELAHQDYPSVIQSILQELSQSTAPNLKLEITKSIACQSAIKNGMPLSERAITKLLKDWQRTPRNETCPHGRPIKLDFPMTKLFQWFHPA
jgi:DNA mismatch repair protein MutL